MNNWYIGLWLWFSSTFLMDRNAEDNWVLNLYNNRSAAGVYDCEENPPIECEEETPDIECAASEEEV